jgi:hypothetical protein
MPALRNGLLGAKPLAAGRDLSGFAYPPQYSDLPACAGVEADLFYPHVNDAVGIEMAKSVCRECPIIGECLERALLNREWWGVWGGTSERERHKLIHRMYGDDAPQIARSPECGSEASYQRHLRLGEETDPLCRQAHNAARNGLKAAGA